MSLQDILGAIVAIVAAIEGALPDGNPVKALIQEFGAELQAAGAELSGSGQPAPAPAPTATPAQPAAFAAETGASPFKNLEG